jgi:hypothetical protein
MTTKITIENDKASNGDIHIIKSAGFSPPVLTTITPGEIYSQWVATGHVITLQETYPTTKPYAPVEADVAPDAPYGDINAV